MASPGLPVLNVSLLPEEWPKWRQLFEIYILAEFNNKLEDRQKLAKFLQCLGPDGIKLINGWFPALRNINSPLAMEVSFAMVWNKMHAHFQDLDGQPDSNVEGQVNSSEVERYLCELEDLAADEQQKSNSVIGFLETGCKLCIDATTLARYPIPARDKLYIEFAIHTANLEISGIPDWDLEKLLTIFTNLIQLTLKDVSFLGRDVTKYPLKLQHLKLVQCASENIFEWLDLNRTSLETLHLEEVKCLSKTPLMYPFEKLKSLTLIGSQGFSRRQFPICPIIETLYLDVPKAVFYFPWLPRSPLKNITLTQEPSRQALQMMKAYRQLRHLTILNKVDPKYRKEIEGLQLLTCHVNYLEVDAEEGRIFSLNEKCLEHVLTYLPKEDWLSLKKCHPEFDRLITDQRNITYYIDSITLRNRPLGLNHAFYAEMGQMVTSLVIGKVSAKKFVPVLKCFSKLSALEFLYEFESDLSFETYFSILPNIRVFKAINCILPFSPFFSLNMHCMEHLEVGHFNDELFGLFVCRMPKLRILQIFMSAERVKQCPDRCCPALEELTLHDLSTGVDKFLAKLDGRKLRTINGLPRDSKYDLKRFPLFKE